MTSEAIAILQARRDAVFASARLAEEACSEAWNVYDRKSRKARDFWLEHAALCEAIDVLSQRGNEREHGVRGIA